MGEASGAFELFNHRGLLEKLVLLAAGSPAPSQSPQAQLCVLEACGCDCNGTDEAKLFNKKKRKTAKLQQCLFSVITGRSEAFFSPTIH